jgi:hypothetical protein
MTTISIKEHAMLMCRLAEYQDELDDAADKATIEYLHAKEIARNKLEALRQAISKRDVMSAARKIVGDRNGLS